MGRPKGSGTGKRGASKTRRIASREPEEESEEVQEVIEEIDEIGKETVSSRRGASASKTAKKAAKPKRETKRKAAKDEIVIFDEEDEDEPKGKRSGRNTVELAFSKSDDSGAESAEDSKKKKESKSASNKASSSKGKRPGSKSKTIVKKAKREEGEDEDDDEEDEREYEVERIIEVKTVNKKREFLIKWKGFSIDNSTWEPEENLDHSKDLVQVFLSKVEKGDVSRTRRLSTIQSTKSSSSSVGGGVAGTGLRRTQQGRVTKSRSRTPSRRSVAKSDQQTEEEEAPLRPTKREPNGNLALQKFMRESVERKLELLKNKERPRPESSTLGTVAEEGGRDRVDGRAPPTSSLRNNNVNNRRGFGVFARTALACSAAAASAAALYLTSPDTLNWEHIAPHVRDAISNIQERYAQLRAQAPF